MALTVRCYGFAEVAERRAGASLQSASFPPRLQAPMSRSSNKEPFLTRLTPSTCCCAGDRPANSRSNTRKPFLSTGRLYGLGDRDAGFYAEFLTPLMSSEYRRNGKPDVTERVGDVVAQKLRHLEVLLVQPWSVTANRGNGFDLAEPAVLQIPNPSSYMIQKLLIHDRRKPAERAKDVLYIHDTIELFSDSLPALRRIWTDSISPALSSAARRTVSGAAEEIFGAVNDTIREAA